MRATRLTPLVMTAAILAVVWVTNSAAVPFMPRTGTTSHDATGVSQQQQTITGQHNGAKDGMPDPMGDFGVVLTFYIVLGLVVVTLLTFLAYAIWHTDDDEEEAPPRPVAAPADLEGIATLDLPAALVDTTSDQLRRIREGTPRNAIVACWWELERACASTGVPRAPYETSSEFTARVLGRYLLDRDVADGFAALYREARFSQHELCEGHREQAIAALQQVVAGLHTRRADPAVSGTVPS